NCLAALAKKRPRQDLEELRCYLWVLALDPGDPKNARNLWVFFNNRGIQLTKQRKYEAAVPWLSLGLAIDPKSFEMANTLCAAYNGWALHLADNKEWVASLDKFKEGIKALTKKPELTGRTHLIAQAIAAQGVVSPGAASAVVPQPTVSLGV